MIDAMTSDEPAPPAAVHVRNVLVPLDGSELSLQAMPTARALARRFGADIHTVTVAESDHDVDRFHALATAVLDVPAGSDRAYVVAGGDPAAVIAQRAAELGAVVCLATHGRGRLSGAILGSVARAVLQSSTDPLVALGPSADNPGWSPRPRSWPEPLSVPRMVACVDGSSTSEQILPVAAAWAAALDLSLTILTIIDDAPDPVHAARSTSAWGDHADAESYVDGLVQRWRPHLAATDGEVVRDPIGLASAVRSHLDERPAGLVALTSHGRSGYQRVRLGAAGAKIVNASVAPCLVAPVQR
jgi:nucleotide-binding universal stress UspA family protein